MATSREEIHRLVDELPNEALAEAARALRRVGSPKRRPSLEEVFANAPVSEEALTNDERAAIAQARADLAAGRLLRLSSDVIDVPLYWQRWRLDSLRLGVLTDAVRTAARRHLPRVDGTARREA
jgi:hypothetical protein